MEPFRRRENRLTYLRAAFTLVSRRKTLIDIIVVDLTAMGFPGASPTMCSNPSVRRVAIVTGASSGIGKAVAIQLAHDNYNLVLVALDADALGVITRELAPFPIDALSHQGDVTRTGEARQIADRTLDAFGHIDVLVNSAGYAVYGPVESMHLDDINGQMLTNYVGTVSLIKECLPHLKATKGAIINIASTAGLTGMPRLAAYSASKHAVVGFSEALNYELDGTGVSVSVIAPGKVKTNIFTHPSFKDVRWAHDDSGITPDVVARVIGKAIRQRRFLYILPSSRKLALFLKSMLPDVIVKRFVER
jgi:uncharacterized protein